MKITRHFAWNAITWSVLPELPSRLARFDVQVDRVSVMLGAYPEEVELDSLEEARDYTQQNGRPHVYSIRLHGKRGEKAVEIDITRLHNFRDQRIQLISLGGSMDRSLLQSVAEFLGLKEDAPQMEPTPLARSVFIAHRFDEVGTACADKIARCLELIGFSVVSGRGYSPISVTEKVRNRLRSQAILVVVLTPGDDATWLIQESVFADASGKPVIILRDASTTFKPALFADLEYIPFVAPAVETAFIPLLEGLRELGYLPSESS